MENVFTVFAVAKFALETLDRMCVERGRGD